MEELLKHLLNEYQHLSYIVIFIWCIFEGEIALILGGIMAHETHINLPLGIFVAGLGAFAGDQIYFFIGRYNRSYITKKFKKKRRKFAIAHLLLQRHGWEIIFLQRYMYGFRTILPMSIGLTGYDAKKFAFINLLSGWVWASITMIPAWYFGQEIWIAIDWIEKHWYFAIPIIIIFILALYFLYRNIENTMLKKRKERRKNVKN